MYLAKIKSEIKKKDYQQTWYQQKKSESLFQENLLN